MSHTGHLGQLGQQWVESGECTKVAHFGWAKEDAAGQRSGQGESLSAVLGRLGQLGGGGGRWWAAVGPAIGLLQGHMRAKNICDMLSQVIFSLSSALSTEWAHKGCFGCISVSHALGDWKMQF